MATDTYREIEDDAFAEIKIKGSRFIGAVLYAGDEAQAQSRLREVRKREYNATHNCWAYRLGQTADHFRYSDDGEPSGSAGLPIMKKIDGLAVTNLLVVVTRYYGGTKLGVGGLSRAYGEAAETALTACKIVTRIVREHIDVTFDYADTSPAMHTIEQFDVNIVNSVYGDATTLTLAVRQSEITRFKASFVENLAGRGRIAP